MFNSQDEPCLMAMLLYTGMPESFAIMACTEQGRGANRTVLMYKWRLIRPLPVPYITVNRSMHPTLCHILPCCWTRSSAWTGKPVNEHTRCHTMAPATSRELPACGMIQTAMLMICTHMSESEQIMYGLHLYRNETDAPCRTSIE